MSIFMVEINVSIVLPLQRFEALEVGFTVACKIKQRCKTRHAENICIFCIKGKGRKKSKEREHRQDTRESKRRVARRECK
jgi:hypothetical protein